MQIREEDYIKMRDALLYVKGSMTMLNDILKTNTCNDCGISRKCAYCPRPGESVLYNCPLWQPKAEQKEG